jgi:small subunit ribosomal protein S16
MLSIRMQRTGRKGHAMFRMVVQEARLAPTSGRVVAQLGSYDPHTKAVTLDKEKASTYLQNGARPSDRVARLLKSQGVKLPEWVILEGKKSGNIRNPEKLRKNRPASTETAADEPAETATADEAASSQDSAEEKAS